jgi:hypothetical protein
MASIDHMVEFFAYSSIDLFVHMYLHVLRGYTILRNQIDDLISICCKIGIRKYIQFTSTLSMDPTLDSQIHVMFFLGLCHLLTYQQD